MKLVHSLFGAVVILIGTWTKAQTPISDVMDAAAYTEVTFMSWETAQRGLVTTRDGREFSPVEAPAYDTGKPSRIATDTPLRLYQSVLRDGKPAYEVVGEAALPPGCRSAQAYLVRLADKDGLRNYRVIAMSNDPEAFKTGEVRAFNFSQYPAMIKVSGTTLSLAPLEWRTVSGSPDHKYRVPLITTVNVSGNWTRPLRNLVSLRPNQRGNVLIVHTQAGIGEIEAAGGEPRMMVLAGTEYLPSPPKVIGRRLSALTR